MSTSTLGMSTGKLITAWEQRGPTLYASMFLFAALVFLAGVAKGVLWGVPPPVAQDEFGYLLTADTLASGRLANPPHPMWRHIESMFVIQHPAYNSKYQTAQSMFLAFGQLLAKKPIVGVWVSSSVAAAALCWMFWQWLTPQWAVLGALVAAVHLSVSYWNFTYWGGSVAAIGSALLFGVVRRFPERIRVLDGVLVGIALFLFVGTRPFEGLVACVFAAAAFTVLLATGTLRLQPPALLRLAVPAALLFAGTAFFTGYYNWRNTSHPTEFPQTIHYRDYYPVPFLITGRAGPEPALAPAYIKVQYEYDRHEFEKQRTLSGFFAALSVKLRTIWSFYAGFGLLLPFAALFALRHDPWLGFAAVTVLLTVFVVLLETWVFPHYLAPIAGLLFLLPAIGLSALWHWRIRHWRVGRATVVSIVLFHLALIVVAIVHRPTYIATQQPWAAARQQIVTQLNNSGGDHLILVHYSSQHDPHEEWVYNRADLDAAPIVWAHDLLPSENAELLNYFSHRTVWRLDADANPPRLSRGIR